MQAPGKCHKKTIYQVLRLKSRRQNLPIRDRVQLWLYEMHIDIRLEILRIESGRTIGIEPPIDPVDLEGYKPYETKHLSPPKLLKPKINFYELARNY